MAKPGNYNVIAGGLQASKHWRALAITCDPNSLRAYVQRYLEALLVAHYSQATVYTRTQYLSRFVTWCEERSVSLPGDVTRPLLERFVKHLYQHRRIDGRPTRASSQKTYLNSLRVFFRWLKLGSHIAIDPSADLLAPRLPLRQLPEPLTLLEIERAFGQLDPLIPIELRDRAMWEVMYSTGLRRTEMAALKLHDIDRAQGMLFVRQGKGKKDRVVPIGERAIAWVDKYLDELRSDWVSDRSEDYLFLNPNGRPLTASALTARGRQLLNRAGIAKAGSCHIFRHSMATHMLDGGADVRYVQEMLGHKNLSSTQIYTHVSTGKLKAVHTATHPRARLAKMDAPARDQSEPAEPGVLQDPGASKG